MSDIYYEFARLQNFIKAHRKLIVLAFAFVFLFVGFYQASAAIDWDPTDELSRSILSSTIGVLAAIVNVIAWAVGQLIIAVLGMLIIPILGYNNFGSSAIIDIGWPLVRDVVNMFVIVVLLVIAIKTILNSKSTNWEQQLPRLFIAVILVNFSRTLTLLIVDAGQVVMFTFVNALRDIAAGNFVSLFQLNEILSLAQPSEENASYGFELFGFLGTAYANLVLLMIVLAVVVVLAIVFVYRIIMIWVLVILSPIAFFAQGLKDVLPQAAGQASKWWDKLVGVVTLGPILVFFLWLGLAAATSGAVATTEGFNLDKTEDSSSLYSEVFQVEQLLSMLIGVILIMVGFQAASGAAGAMGGIAATLVNEKTGTQIAKNAAMLPASLGYKGVRAGARQLERRTGVGANVGSQLSKFGSEIAKTPGLRMVGKGFMAAGNKVGGIAEGSVDQARKNAKEDVASMTSSRKIAELRSAPTDEKGNFKNPLSMKDLGQQQALMVDLATSKQSRKNLKNELSDEAKGHHKTIDADKSLSTDEKAKRKAAVTARYDKEYEQIISRSLKHVEKNKSDLIDDSNKKNFFAAKAGHMRHMIDKYRDPKTRQVSEANRAKALLDVNELISDDDFSMSMLSKEDMKDEVVLEAVKNKTVREFVDEKGQKQQVKMIEDVESGKGVTDEVRDAAQGKGATFGKAAAHEIGQALRHDNLQIQSLKVEDLTTDGSVDITKLDVGAGGSVEKIAQAMAFSKSDVGDAPAVLRDAIDTELERLSLPSVTTDSQRRGAYIKGKYSNDNDSLTASANLVGSLPGAPVAADRKKLIQEVVVEQPTQLYKLDAHITAGIAPSASKDAQQVLSVVSREMTPKIIDQMQKELTKATNSGNAEMVERIKKSSETAFKAVKHDYDAAVGPAGNPANIDTELRNKYRKLDVLRRNAGRA